MGLAFRLQDPAASPCIWTPASLLVFGGPGAGQGRAWGKVHRSTPQICTLLQPASAHKQQQGPCSAQLLQHQGRPAASRTLGAWGQRATACSGLHPSTRTCTLASCSNTRYTYPLISQVPVVLVGLQWAAWLDPCQVESWNTGLLKGHHLNADLVLQTVLHQVGSRT